MSEAATAFDGNPDFLAELCRYADALLERALWTRQGESASDTPESLASRRRIAREQHARELDELLSQAWQQLQARMDASVAQGCFIPWAHLVRLFQLTPGEQKLVLVALLPELNADYRMMLAQLAEGEAAADDGISLSAAARLLSDERNALQPALLADSPLRRWHIVELEPSGDALRLTGGVRLDPLLAAYLCGRAAPQLRVDEVLAELPAPQPLAALPIDAQALALAERFLARCGAAAPAAHAFLLQLQGPDERLLERVCAAIFAALQMSCVRLDAVRWFGRGAGTGSGAMRDRLRLLCRDALLCNRVLVLSGWQRAGAHTDDEYRAWTEAVLDTLLESQRYVVAINGPERALARQAHRYENHPVAPLLIRVPLPDAALRRAIWSAGAQDRALPLSDAELDKLADHYRFTHAQIEAVWKELDSRRLLDGGDGDAAALLEICRDASVVEQFSVAEEVKTRYRLDDIVLPPATRGWLQEMLHYAQHRHRVIEQWGFGRSHGNSRNLCVLFHGPSGTGKTMAASIVANELNLGLYRVDLANVLSKYIGETEKHLAQLFDQAEAMDVVLYFDEAESLFGKRTETQDAHDRYANLQTGYLLQRIETYPGVVILSTNLLGNMDKAFMRRFKFVIEYPFPDAAQRQALWRKAFPAEAPLGEDVDFALLAQKATLSGGNINTIALRAAMYAAAEDRSVSMDHLLRAVEREYDKLGKVFASEDFAWEEDD